MRKEPSEQSVQALPPGVSVLEGELKPIRFSNDFPHPNDRPLQALTLGDTPALLFRDEIWVAPAQQELSTARWERSPLSDYFTGAQSAAWLDQEWLSDLEGLAQWNAVDQVWRRPSLSIVLPLLKYMIGLGLREGDYGCGVLLTEFQ